MRSSRSTIHTFWGLAALLYRVFESSLQSILNNIQRGNNYSYVQEFLFEFVLRHTSRMVKIYITYSPNRLSFNSLRSTTSHQRKLGIKLMRCYTYLYSIFMKIVTSSKLMVNSCRCYCLINDFDICLCEDIEVNYIF